MPLDQGIAQRLKRNEAGLVCAVAQDATTRRVLMVAWMNDEALEETLRTRRGVYFSRSRNEIWRKGETSGNVQHVVSVEVDCDGDSLLLMVEQIGGACHTGKDSCFDEGGPLELGPEGAP
jgi:phosphoribosyl-AMP cyclohydrolase